MRLGILGPLLAADDGGREVRVTAARQRTLLAALLVWVNRPVHVDELAEVVWDGRPPAGAARTVRSYVMRLRLTVGPDIAARILTRDPGYLCRLAEDELDVLRFEALCREGADALRVQAWQQADELLAEALGLWRGEPLLDVPSQALREQFAPRVEQLRLQALEDRAEAGLALGRHDRLVPELRNLTAEHPLRERFHAQLMLALARAGRQAEALEAYQHARRVLVEELGIEPGPELRRLQERVLAGDEKLAAPPWDSHAAVAATAVPAGPVPRQLPAAVRHFTGRQAESDALTGLIGESGQAGAAGGAVVISAIGGTAGVGKTALAVHWARRVADRFPDGQLYVNLRGYDADEPMPATDALAGFLRALGVPGQEIGPDPQERAARYRSLLAGRRMLVLLDNARDAEQVRPLLPGSDGCVVLVTSRDSLAGLVARDGAARLDLDVLPPAEAVALLRTLIGSRVGAAPEAARALADRCCGLPLALRIAAELAVTRPDTPLDVLVGELADETRRLDLLDAGGDPRAAVRPVFSWSYRHLEPAAARAFRLIGLHPGPDLERYAVAALIGTEAGQADRLLGRLAQAHLIQVADGAPRYSMHDLLRAYARELAAAEDGEQQVRAELTRLFDHYLYSASAAMAVLYPAETDYRPHVEPPATGATVPMPDAATARAWLGAELANLVAVVRYAAEHDWPTHAGRLASTLFRYLDTGGHFAEAAIVHEHARRAAEQSGDAGARAAASSNLGVLEWRHGRYKAAADHFLQTLASARASGDRTGEIRALANLCLVEMRQGRYASAAEFCHQALPRVRAAGERVTESRLLANLGGIELRLGRHDQAVEHFERSYTLCRAVGDRGGEAYALANLGLADLQRDRYQQAAARIDQALAMFRADDDRAGQLDAMAHLGRLELRLGHHERAAEHLEHALAMSRSDGFPDAESEVLNILGELSLAEGRPEFALARHNAARDLAERLTDDYELAHAHRGLARTHAALGDPARARDHRREALTLYTRLGVPEAAQVADELASGAEGPGPEG